MRKRVPPSEQVKQALTTLLAEGSESAEHPLDQLIRLGARHVWQVAFEQDVTEWLGRAHYQRGPRRRRGWRTGYEPKGLQTPLGTLALAVPQVRGTEDPFPARVAQVGGTRSGALERLATRMWVRGRSQADVEALFLETVGSRVISRTGVSEVSRHLQADCEAWQRRDLSALKVVSCSWMQSTWPCGRGRTNRKACSARPAFWRRGRRCCCIWRWGAASPTTPGCASCTT